MTTPTPQPPINLAQAAEAVRRHRAELDNATVTRNFHQKMASSAFDEVKKHQRNLTQAEATLARVAASPSTGAGVPATTPKPKQPATIQGR